MDPHNGWSMDYVTQEYQLDSTGKPVAIYYPHEGFYELDNQSDFTASFDRIPSDSTVGYAPEAEIDANSLAMIVSSGETDIFDRENELPESLRLDVPLNVEAESQECSRIEGNPVAVLNIGLLERWKHILPHGQSVHKRSVVNGLENTERAESRFSNFFCGQNWDENLEYCFDRLQNGVEDEDGKGAFEYYARIFELDLGIPARDLCTRNESHMWRIGHGDQ